MFAVFSNPKPSRTRTRVDFDGRSTRSLSRFFRNIKNRSIRTNFATSAGSPVKNPIVKTLSSSRKMHEDLGCLFLDVLRTWPRLMCFLRTGSVNGYHVHPSEYIAWFSAKLGRVLSQFQRLFAEPLDVVTPAGFTRRPRTDSSRWKVCITGNPIFSKCSLEARLLLPVERRATFAPFLLAHSTSEWFSFPAIPRPRYCSWILTPSSHAMYGVWRLAWATPTVFPFTVATKSLAFLSASQSSQTCGR